MAELVNDPALEQIAEHDVAKAKEAFDADKKAYLDTIDVEKKDEELQSARQDRIERKKYASRVFRLLRWWVIGVFLLLLFQGFLGTAKTYNITKSVSLHDVKFSLSDSVLIAVVSGTTASVIGIFLVVANYLFPKR